MASQILSKKLLKRRFIWKWRHLGASEENDRLQAKASSNVQRSTQPQSINAVHCRRPEQLLLGKPFLLYLSWFTAQSQGVSNNTLTDMRNFSVSLVPLAVAFVTPSWSVSAHVFTVQRLLHYRYYTAWGLSSSLVSLYRIHDGEAYLEPTWQILQI